MAFNIAIFKTRALTAVLFAVIMLAGLLLNKWSFILLFNVIHVGCWYEFIKLIKKIYVKNYGYYLPIGLLYITLPVLMMLHLGFQNIVHPMYQKGYEKAFEYSFVIPCAIIFSIWINDTMAYIVGSWIGKTPFSKISPNKTLEGTIGGAILCVLVTGYVIAPFVYAKLALYVTRAQWFVLAAICAVSGTLGDLLESKLKRMAAVKDSGNFMPGHGGFLDRFDSFLVAVPFVWLYVCFLMR